MYLVEAMYENGNCNHFSKKLYVAKKIIKNNLSVGSNYFINFHADGVVCTAMNKIFKNSFSDNGNTVCVFSCFFFSNQMNEFFEKKLKSYFNRTAINEHSILIEQMKNSRYG